jgi:hypothetical protein
MLMHRSIGLLILFLLLSSPSWAATWYVRDGGGTPSQCTGKTNAVYPGSGNAQPCAFNSTMYVTGIGCSNYNQGGGGCSTAPLMSGGDTVYIDGDSDISPGTQAQYRIGYLSTGTNPPGCVSNNCGAGGLPSGTSGNPTSLIGCNGYTSGTCNPAGTTGHFRPQIWGSGASGQVVLADADYVVLNNLEVTDHSNCLFGGPVNGCSESSAAAEDGWAKIGVYYGGTGSIMENLWIHGLFWGTSSDNLTNYTSENNVISGNSFNGDGPGGVYSSGTVTFTGPITWNNDQIVYNGCGEKYPMHSQNPYDTQNYTGLCYDQANAGQGDGLGSQAGTTICSGNFYWTNDDISFNTQDGIDFLHCNSAGNAYIYRTRTEGNEGQQVKINMQNANIENSEIIGDCYYHNSGNPIDFNNGSMNNCRAGGDAIALIMNGGNYYIDNSTVLATGPGIQDVGNSANCAGNLYWYNDNVIGGWETPVYGNNQTATWFDYECTNANPPTFEDYNHVWNTNNQSQCAGAHDVCNDSSSGTTASLGSTVIGPTSYYQGNDLGHLLYPSTTGRLIGAANNAISLTGTSNDFNNYSRGSSWTIGSYQVGSTVVNGGTCFSNGECASGGCAANMCTGSCSANGNSCSTGSTCCSGACNGSTCVAYFCGDGIITSPEVCDTNGPALGGATCQSLGFTSGSLGCATGCLSYNTSGCSGSTANIVQHAGNYSATATTSGTVTLSPTGSGNLIVVALSKTVATQVTDGTNLFTVVPGSSNQYWYLPNSTAGKTTITASFPSTNWEMEVWEVSNLVSPMLDTVSNNTTGIQSGGIATGSSLTTASIPEVLFSFDKSNSSSSVSNPNWISGGDILFGDSYVSSITTTTGTFTPTWTDGGTSFASESVSFKNGSACYSNGNACTVSGQCCSGICSNSFCVATTVIGSKQCILGGQSVFGGQSVL